MAEVKESKALPWIIERKITATLTFGECRISIAIDTSGSTAGRVLIILKKLAALFGGTIYISWNDAEAKLFETLEDKDFKSGGGTCPVTILEGKALADVQKANAMLFLTDGEIGQGDVENFSKKLHLAGHLGLIICAVVQNHQRATPGQINVSVFAPLIATGRCVIIYYNDTGNPYLLHASAGLDLPEAKITPETKWDELPRPSIEQLKALAVNVMDPLPDGYMAMGNFGVNMHMLFQQTLDDAELVALPMDRILLIAKTLGMLPALREWLHKYERVLADREAKLRADFRVQGDLPTPSQIIAAIQQSTDEKEKVTLRQQFKDSVAAEKKHESLIQNMLETSIGAVRRFVQQNLAAIAETEKSGYSMTDMATLSNRARRANTVKEVTADDRQSLVLEGACRGVCSIIQEEGVLVLMLRELPNPEDNTQDHCINFPLGYGARNCVIISPDIIRMETAERMILNGQDSTRVKVTGFIPAVSLQHEENINYFFRCAAKNLTGGKALPHIGMMMFAALYEIRNKDWAKDHPVIPYMMQQLLENIKTTPTFCDISKTALSTEKVPLLQACGHVIDKAEFHNQPLSACLLLASLAVERKLVRPEVVVPILRQRVIKEFLGAWRAMLRNPESAKEFLRHYEREFYDASYGRAMIGTAKEIRLSECKSLPILLGAERHGEIMGRLKPYGIDEFLPPRDFTAVMHTIAQQQVCNLTLDNWVLELQKDDLFVSAFRSLEIKDCCGPMNRSFPFALAGDAHRFPPPFVSRLGPSMLVCTCGHQFTEGLVIGQPYSADEIKEHVLARRRAHFEQKDVYSAANPSAGSAQVPLHTRIRDVIDLEFKEHKGQVTRPMVLAVLRAIYRSKGNVHSRDLMLDTVLSLTSYLSVCQQQPHAVDRSQRDHTVQGYARTGWELQLLGHSYPDVVEYRDDDRFLIKAELPIPMAPNVPQELLAELMTPLSDEEWKFVNGL
jgi:hypothetical protein